MTAGRVNPEQTLEHQGIRGLRSVAYNLIEPALVQAAVSPDVAGQILNVGSGHEYRIADVAALIVSLTGGTAELRKGRLPAGTDPIRLACDSTRIQKLLGWDARTSMAAGLEQTIAWYRNTRPL